MPLNSRLGLLKSIYSPAFGKLRKCPPESAAFAKPGKVGESSLSPLYLFLLSLLSLLPPVCVCVRVPV